MSDNTANPDDAASAADCKSPACSVLDPLSKGGGICLGKFAFSLSSLLLRTELVVQSSLEVKKNPRNET